MSPRREMRLCFIGANDMTLEKGQLRVPLAESLKKYLRPRDNCKFI